MEKFRPNPDKSHAKPAIGSEHVYHALNREREEIMEALASGEEFFSEAEILNLFTPEQQAEIKQKQQILSSLAYFIGKDFRIPVELGLPTKQCPSGWRQGKNLDGKEFLQMNAYDLLEKPMDFLRFVTCHEGGHKRISRLEVIPLEEWNQPGFAFMMNAIEDPRDNNFVAESYPKFREQMGLAYAQDLDFEGKAKEKAAQKLGYQPRFMQAGFEYIKQWFREAEGKDVELTADLSEEVKAVVMATLESARDSWLRYPSREEADKSEELIKKYAKVSYEINRDEIWPEFKKLVDADMEDQKAQELLNKTRQKKAGGDSADGLLKELKEKLSSEEQKELAELIKEAVEGKPINIGSISKELKQKIKAYIESLPEEQQREIVEKAQAAFKEFEDALNEELRGKLSDDPEKKAERKEGAESAESKKEKPIVQKKENPADETEEFKKYKEQIAEELKKDANVYEEMRREVLPIIDRLETELREIFVARRAKGWQSGFKTGKHIDIKRRIQEKAKSVPAMESHAWQKRELPKEKDYAITLLVDLSGSMASGQKIQETFKGVIVLSEALNRLSINLEILGFNNQIHEYQNFGQPMSKQIREQMGGMLEEVDSYGANWNDDGWALEQASNRLTKQKADQKFLVVFSDGIPVESDEHAKSKYELGKMVKKVINETDIRLVGLGVGKGTKHVSRYYPNSIANVNVKEMAEKLAGLIKELIVNYDKF